MAELFRFVDVHCAGTDRTFSFILGAGEIRLLQLASKDEKEAMIDMAVGNAPCLEGRIEIVQGERRSNGAAVNAPQRERRRKNLSIPEIWLPLDASRPGRIGWVAGQGGLISNLKIWENVTLPLWYHTRRETLETERSIAYWLEVLGIAPEAFAEFMAAPPFSLAPWQRKLAGLLRALVQMPRVLVVDAAVFEDIAARLASRWITALETYAAQGRAVLVLADKATMLPWEKIE